MDNGNIRRKKEGRKRDEEMFEAVTSESSQTESGRH
jgi:hypothetical protein